MTKKEKFKIDGSALFANMDQSDTDNKSSKGRPKNNSLIRETGAQKGLPAELTRQTLIVSVEQIETIKNYAYTERLKVKDVVAAAFEEYIEKHVNPDELLIRPENWR